MKKVVKWKRLANGNKILTLTRADRAYVNRCNKLGIIPHIFPAMSQFHKKTKHRRESLSCPIT